MKWKMESCGRREDGMSGWWDSQRIDWWNHVNRASGAKGNSMTILGMGIPSNEWANSLVHAGMGWSVQRPRFPNWLRIDGCPCRFNRCLSLWHGQVSKPLVARPNYRAALGMKLVEKWVLRARSIVKVVWQCLQARCPGCMSVCGSNENPSDLIALWFFLRWLTKVFRPIISWQIVAPIYLCWLWTRTFWLTG